MQRLVWEPEPSEETPIDVDNLNLMSNYIYTKQAKLVVGEEIQANTNLTIPIMYKVGDGVLDVYYNGTKLIKDEHYIEVSNLDSVSNRIQLKDWGARVGDIFEFVVKGEWGTANE